MKALQISSFLSFRNLTRETGTWQPIYILASTFMRFVKKKKSILKTCNVYFKFSKDLLHLNTTLSIWTFIFVFCNSCRCQLMYVLNMFLIHLVEFGVLQRYNNQYLFLIHQLKDQREKFPASFFRNTRPVGKSESFINAREIMEFFRFKAGDYLIVPSTFEPNEASSFLLTVYSKTEAVIE